MSAEIVVKSEQSNSTAQHDSEEYESAEEVEGSCEEVEVEVEEEISDEDAEGQHETEVDDDQDRKNPQFIPKKGYFYEHDDRTNAEEEDAEEDVQKVERSKPKASKIEDRWTHDLFNEVEQAPKTKAELSGRYGYDISSDDQPPRARRRRRYGRGPNKYTRKWEEEEAYQKPRGGFRGRPRGPRSGGEHRQPPNKGDFDKDFPELGSSSTGKGNSRDDKGESTAEPQPKATEITREERGDNRRGSSRQFGKERHFDEGSGFRGRGGNLGRGRRNEFSNRNRYPDRRGSGPEREQRVKPEVINVSKQQVEKASTKTERSSKPNDNRIEASKSGPSGHPSNDVKESPALSSFQQSTIALRNPPPFTNTEYRGSESLAGAKLRQANHENLSFHKLSRELHKEEVYHGYGCAAETVSNVLQREDRGDTGSRGHVNKQYQSDRRAQIPPRLQQHQVSEPTHSSVKPKRFSQRQRQVEEPSVANMTVGPASSPKQQAQVNSQAGPGPSGIGHVVPKPVAYPQSQGYYESGVQGQVYEASSINPISGSPHGPGPSSSPSVWVPHSSPYATAPSYPSPPTAPQVPTQSYPDPSAFMPPPQQPPIFAPPHPQFIQDPTIINYVPPQPPPPNYPPSFHAPGIYPQMAPPPAELYAGVHAGVTYYSTQNQMRPHMPVMSKRPKTVLKLVEPAEKKDGGRQSSGGIEKMAFVESEISEPQTQNLKAEKSSLEDLEEHSASTAESGNQVKNFELEGQLESLKLQPEPERAKKSPSPAPLDLGPTSWAEQMADVTPLNSPTDKSGPELTAPVNDIVDCKDHQEIKSGIENNSKKPEESKDTK